MKVLNNRQKSSETLKGNAREKMKKRKPVNVEPRIEWWEVKKFKRRFLTRWFNTILENERMMPEDWDGWCCELVLHKLTWGIEKCAPQFNFEYKSKLKLNLAAASTIWWGIHSDGQAGHLDTQVCACSNSRTKWCGSFKLIPWLCLWKKSQTSSKRESSSLKVRGQAFRKAWEQDDIALLLLTSLFQCIEMCRHLCTANLRSHHQHYFRSLGLFRCSFTNPMAPCSLHKTSLSPANWGPKGCMIWTWAEFTGTSCKRL